MKLPRSPPLAFKIDLISISRKGMERVFRAQACVLVLRRSRLTKTSLDWILCTLGSTFFSTYNLSKARYPKEHTRGEDPSGTSDADALLAPSPLPLTVSLTGKQTHV